MTATSGKSPMGRASDRLRLETHLPLSGSGRTGLMFKERPLNLPPGRPRAADLSILSVVKSVRSRLVYRRAGNRSASAVELFPMHDRIAYQGITFDDILLEPGYSELLPHQVDTRSQLTAKIGLNIPILSSPMDTVTEAELAIALRRKEASASFTRTCRSRNRRAKSTR